MKLVVSWEDQYDIKLVHMSVGIVLLCFLSRNNCINGKDHMAIIWFIVVDFTSFYDIDYSWMYRTVWLSWLLCVHFGNPLWNHLFKHCPAARQACRACLDVFGQNRFQLVSELIPIIPWGDVAGVAHRSKHAIVKRLIVQKDWKSRSLLVTASY